jgi:hypothetical protein
MIVTSKFPTKVFRLSNEDYYKIFAEKLVKRRTDISNLLP